MTPRHRAQAGGLLVLLAALAFGSDAHAQIARNFAARYTFNGSGSITLTGNTILTCDGTGSCANAQNGIGGNVNNDNRTMVYVDVDGDPTTFSSSEATLSLPPGAIVVWAGLYWGGVSPAATRNTVKLAVPAGAYANVTASQLDAIGDVYQGFRDVTAQVAAAGSGTYRVANVASTTGASDVWGGWSIVVVYRLDSITPRNLVVADGFMFVRPGNPLTFGVTGFLTPPTGTVQTSVGAVTYDGDLGFTGEDFVLNGTVLSDALNPANNVYNSSLTLLGTPITSRNPNYPNTLGFDADILAANGVLANGSSSATIELKSASDRYYPGVITFNTEIYLPRFDATSFTKTVTDLNAGDVRPGDILEYVVSATNSGTDDAGQCVVRDTLPANVTYVAGSLSVLSGPNTGNKTDAASDDQMDYLPATRTVVARIGTGANGANGGTLGIGVTSAVRFRVQVTPPAVTGTVLSNQAAIACIGVIQGIVVNERSDGDPVAIGVQPTTATVTSSPILGTVFEDANYGGGAGRSLVAAAGARVSGARVELYDLSGNYKTATLTDSTGAYRLDGWAPGGYRVRVVNATVNSTRPGSIAGLLPVQTFRTDATTGAAVAVADRVGGENPSRMDAVSNLSSANLTSLDVAPFTPQSVAPVTLGLTSLSGIDFGFNFSTIVNTRDAGQGSLRQFLINSNQLSNAGLAQNGLPAGVETSIFMITDGAAHPGMRAGLSGMLGNGVARILVQSALPAITEANTRLDGTTQTTNVGNTNATTLGTAGPVGVDALAAPSVAGPEVEIRDGATVALGVDLQAANVTLAGVAVRGFGNAVASDASADVRIGAAANGAIVQACVVGTPATSFADSGAAARSGGDHVRIVGADNGSISGTVIGFGAGAGVAFTAGSNGWALTSVEIRGAGIGNPARAALSIESSSGETVTQARIANQSGAGVDAGGSAGSNTFTNCSVSGNGTGVGAVTAGLRLGGAGGTVDRCVVRDNYGAGVMIAATATNQVVTRGAFSNNGTLGVGGPATGQIGIDLLGAGDATATGTTPFVTRNDLNDADAGANELLNFPVFESAVIRNGQMTLSGWARPGSVVELYVSDGDPSGFGEGATYLTTLTEGSAADLDGAVSAYAPPVNGLDPGSDLTNRFRFNLAIPPGVVAGTALTATARITGTGTSEFSGRVVVETGVDLNGFAYDDADHSASRAAGEAGTQRTLFAKLVSSGGSSASQVAPVDSISGSYVLSAVSSGSWNIVLDTSADPNDLTPGVPAGWIGTEAATGVRVGVSVAAADLFDQNFGLWHGSRVDGTVFRDDGAGGGTANDGARQAGEAGVGGAMVRLLAASCPSGACDSIASDAGGAYRLWIPLAATGTGVTVGESNLTGWLSTGGTAGTTGGLYDRPADATGFTPAAGLVYSGADFGDVRTNVFVAPGNRTVFPGGAVAHPHTYTANSAGDVSFATAQNPTPAIPGWTVTLVHDLDCNGAADPGEPVISGALSLVTGQTICIVARHQSPAGAPVGSSETATLTATFGYTGAAPALTDDRLLDDVTTVTAHGLLVTKSVDLASARPGDTLTYTISYQNVSTQPLSGIVIDDTTPTYTTFASAGCGSLGAGLTACSVTQEPSVGATGAVRWSLAGSLAPGAGGSVTFVVTVE